VHGERARKVMVLDCFPVVDDPRGVREILKLNQ
jgi:hypothetical protein